MDNISINNHFQSIFYLLIHISCSFVQLSCILTILGLQITLTITQTCAFSIGVGFWSFPFLFLSPISIWLLVWKRNLICYCLNFIFHICSTLFATTIIIISFLALIGQIGTSCSTSSSTTNAYFLPLNISLIVISFILKLFIYGEILLLYMLQYNSTQPSILSDKQFQEKNYEIISDDVFMKRWNLFRSILKKNPNHVNDLEI
ncbi:unnamed protein product [Adineta steineri]|uniref:Transmembrane protein n=1 Tax=Adineta steineri TaxID=433720 RepID=A0A813Q1D4_9BILA|nr:unnamed protein product [Adineta steineri]CAF3575127.1 unnamed protein product [Adineta steineri]